MGMMSSPRFLLLLYDIGIKLGAILRNRILMVIINRDLDDLVALGLVSGVVELGHEWVGEGFIGCDTLVGIELEQLLQHVESIGGGSREHVSKGPWARGGERF